MWIKERERERERELMNFMDMLGVTISTNIKEG